MNDAISVFDIPIKCFLDHFNFIINLFVYTLYYIYNLFIYLYIVNLKQKIIILCITLYFF